MSNLLQRFGLAVTAAVLGVAAPAHLTGQAPPATPASPQGDLAAIIAAGTLWQDTNGDGVADAVNARFLVGDPPTLAELAAASDVAARLGFETSAMNLPLASAPPTAPAIVVGAAAAARAGVVTSVPGSEALAPGEGAIVATAANGVPAIVLTGADDKGVLAAADAFAGRLPKLWDPKGPELAGLVSDVSAWIEKQNVKGAKVTVPAVVVRDGGNAFARVDVRIETAAPADAAALDKALRAVAASREPRRPRAGSAAPATPATAPVPDVLTWAGVERVRIGLVPAPAAASRLEIARATTPAADAEPPARRPGVGAKDALDLSSFYSPDGALGDSDNNQIPDRTDVLISIADGTPASIVDVAARIGLESAGVSIPLVRPAAMITAPDRQPTLVLVGLAHPIVDKLVADKKWQRPSLAPGEGLVTVVRKAFGEKGAVIVTGGDAAGLSRAVSQLAERFPHLWPRGKDRPTLDDVEDEVRRFLGGRTPAGQAAMALYKLDRIGRELAGRDLESVKVHVAVEKSASGLDAVVKDAAAKAFTAGSVAVEVENFDVQHATEVRVGGKPISEDVTIPSEVDDFWKVFRARVLPAVKKKQPVVVQARLSEPPEMRAAIEKDALKALVDAGAAAQGSSVEVLSAYKQGYSWLYDRIRPKLQGQQIEKITIRFAEAGPPPEWKRQAMFTPTRWLLELFPIDEVLARELKIDVGRFAFEKAPIGSTTYEVIATGPGGKQILRETFEPKFVLRSYFDYFPEYEKVRVTTGWVHATAAGRTLVDERIVTDVERFWDVFQSKLGAIGEHVMAVHKGRPRQADAPFFGELTVDLTLSEPEYRVGVDQEQIAPMEAMHEEVYFSTLHFFDVLGRHGRGQGLDYPGHIVPIVRPKADGKPGLAKIRFTAFTVARPSVTVEFKERSGATGTRELAIPRIAVERPSAVVARVRAGQDGVSRLELRVKVDSEKDERDALVVRARQERVDEQWLSAEQVDGVLGALGRLRAAGLYKDGLAWPGLGTLALNASWSWDDDSKAKVVELASNGAPAALPDIRKLLPAGFTARDAPAVQWDTPISPPEAYELLAKMSTRPEATVYKVGETYLGKEAWAMDLMPPVKATHWSQAKATTLKPTVVYSARQHANEVSSTSHVLKLAEMLLTDPAWRKRLDKVNVVVHPVTNPDGAQLAYDLQKITPNHMLHAGYLGSLGVDVVNGMWDQDPMYPETKIRANLWRTWLPDIFLNPHGYPSHEWVMLFSEYAGWVRNRYTEARDWWGMRGWFIPGFGWMDDPKYPRHAAAAMTLRERITANINGVPDVRALNTRAYARYRRYGFAFDRENFKLDFTNDVLIYTPIKGAKAAPTNSEFMNRNPAVTIWSGSTEAPDETARGDWMKLVASAGLAWDTAILDYLADGAHEVERKVEPFAGGTSLSLSRPRPPKDKKDAKDEGTRD